MKTKQIKYKRFFGGVASIIICMGAMAENVIPYIHELSFASNALQPGDSIPRLMMEYTDQGDSGEDVLWDFRDAAELDSCAVQYFPSEEILAETDDSTIKTDSIILTGNDSKTAITYLQLNDTLWMKSQVSRLHSIYFHRPVRLLSYPFSYGDTLTSAFSGEGTYCCTYPLITNGMYSVEADGYGSLLLTDGDTIHNVLRIHTTRSSSLRVDIDSDDSKEKQEIEERYQWYARGLRYPVYEMYSVVYYDEMHQTSAVSRAYKTIPDDLYQLSDSVNEEIRASDSLACAVVERQSPLSNYSITVNGTRVTVVFSLDFDATVNVLVCSAVGFVHRKHSEHRPAGTGYSFAIDCSGLRKDTYILYINVNGQIQSETINIR